MKTEKTKEKVKEGEGDSEEFRVEVTKNGVFFFFYLPKPPLYRLTCGKALNVPMEFIL